MVWNCQSLPSIYAQCKDSVQNIFLVGLKERKEEKLLAFQKRSVRFGFGRLVGSQAVTAPYNL